MSSPSSSNQEYVAKNLENLPVSTRLKNDIPTLDENVEISDDSLTPHWSCAKYLDRLYFCVSPVYQATHYYRYGQYNSCRDYISQLYNCLFSKTRLPGHLESKQFMRELLTSVKETRGIDRSSSQTHPVFSLRKSPPTQWLGKPNAHNG